MILIQTIIKRKILKNFQHTMSRMIQLLYVSFQTKNCKQFMMSQKEFLDRKKQSIEIPFV